MKTREKVFVYYRISTELQNFEMQEKSIEKFVKAKNLEVIGEFKDEAMSGALGWERPAFKDMFDKIKAVDGIVLYDWDRISREEEFAVQLMYFLKNKNKFVYESNTGMKLNFNQLQYRIQTFFKSVLASEERLKIKKRQKDGIEAYKENQGRWGPKIKYGKSETGKTYSKDSFWRLYEQYRMARVSKSAIARILSISRTTLYQRLEEDPEKYELIESKV